jgi:hypothetical protein
MDISPGCHFMSLVSCALKHPYSFERQVPQVPHMLIVVGCVCGNVCCYSHDRGFLGLGQQINFVEFRL